MLLTVYNMDIYRPYKSAMLLTSRETLVEFPPPPQCAAFVPPPDDNTAASRHNGGIAIVSLGSVGLSLRQEHFLGTTYYGHRTCIPLL